MLSRVLADTLRENGYQVKLKDGNRVFATDSDVDLMLDEAVRKLKDEPVDTLFEIHRLIVRKGAAGYDVFVMMGEIE